MIPYTNWFYWFMGTLGVGAAVAATTNTRRVIDMRGKLPTGPNQMSYRDPAQVTDISLHHSAGGRLETLESIAQYHIQRWGRGAEYCYAIWKGKVYQLNDHDRKGYHNGYNNTVALGVVILGNYDVSEPEERDLKAFKWLARKLKNSSEFPSLYRLVAHNEYPGASTACPGRFMPVDDLRAAVGLSPFGAAPNTLLAFNAVQYDPSKADN